MQPAPDRVLALIAKKIATQLMAEVDGYLKGDLYLLSSVIAAIAERYENDANIYIYELCSMREIFTLALEDEGARAKIGAAALTEAIEFKCVDYCMSSLRHGVDQQLKLLSHLHEYFCTRGSSTSDLLQRIETFLTERITLHAFEATVYPIPNLASSKKKILSGFGFSKNIPDYFSHANERSRQAK